MRDRGWFNGKFRLNDTLRMGYVQCIYECGIINSYFTLNFNENVRWVQLGTGTATTSFTTSSSGSSNCTTTQMNELLIQISKDNFGNCLYINFTVNGATITIDPKSDLDSGTNYTIKILKRSLSQGYELQDENGRQLEMEYQITFAT